MMDAAREQAIRARIAELENEVRLLREKLPKRPKMWKRVHRLLLDGCNTSRDIADELNITVHLAAAHLHNLGKRGFARRTGRVIRMDGCKAPLTVWEAV